MVQMKHRPGPFTVVAPVIWCMALMLASVTGWCQEQTKQRILIITGGHAFEREAFFNIFGDMTDVGYKEVVQPYANQIYDTELMDQYDVLLFYDMVQEINDHQKKAFVDLLNEGKAWFFYTIRWFPTRGGMNLRRSLAGVMSFPARNRTVQPTGMMWNYRLK